MMRLPFSLLSFAFAALACGDALFRGLDTMIDGVPEKVAERSIELLQNVAIDLRRLTDDLQTNRLAE